MGKIKNWCKENKELTTKIALALGGGLLGAVGGYMLYLTGFANGHGEAMETWANSDWDSFNAYSTKQFDEFMNGLKDELK